TYYETNTAGQSVFSRGTVESDTWIWNNEGSKVNGKPVLVRFTLKQVSSDLATYKFEMGASGDDMKLMMDGKQTRVKGSPTKGLGLAETSGRLLPDCPR